MIEQQPEPLRRFRRDAEYFRDHYAELLARHPDEWVAIFDQTVVAASPDFEALLAELRRKGVAPEHSYVKHLTTTDEILIVAAW